MRGVHDVPASLHVPYGGSSVSADQKQQLEARLEALGPPLVALAEVVVGALSDLAKGQGALVFKRVVDGRGAIIGWELAFRRASEDDATWS